MIYGHFWLLSQVNNLNPFNRSNTCFEYFVCFTKICFTTHVVNLQLLLFITNFKGRYGQIYLFTIPLPCQYCSESSHNSSPPSIVAHFNTWTGLDWTALPGQFIDWSVINYDKWCYYYNYYLFVLLFDSVVLFFRPLRLNEFKVTVTARPFRRVAFDRVHLLAVSSV